MGVLELAHALEQATGFSRRRPPLASQWRARIVTFVAFAPAALPTSCSGELLGGAERNVEHR
jgi:hypothetical protein